MASSRETIHPLFWTVFACKLCFICACFSPDSDRPCILTRNNGLKSLWCIVWLHKMLTPVLDWSGVDYCDVFISSLNSFWRHPFTAEDPLGSKRCSVSHTLIYLWNRFSKRLWLRWINMSTARFKTKTQSGCFYITVFLKETDCLQNILDVIFISSCM